MSWTPRLARTTDAKKLQRTLFTQAIFAKDRLTQFGRISFYQITPDSMWQRKVRPESIFDTRSGPAEWQHSNFHNCQRLLRRSEFEKLSHPKK